MGTEAAVQTRGRLTAAAKEEIASFKAGVAEVERLLNAHDAGSELSRLAACSDEEILARCDASVRPCYEMAFDLMKKSGRAFNPRWRGPETMDLGAIAKGYAIDLARVGSFRAGGPDCLVDVGGNLWAERGSWTTGIAGTSETFVLGEGVAVATSAEYYRGKHIRDGRTGLPVSNEVASVTVCVPGSAMEADGLSTTLFVLGPDEGRRFLTEEWKTSGVRAVWFMKDETKVECHVGF